MRFDDSLDTVLSADTATPFGAQTAWRQIVDLIGRRRAEPTEAAMARLAAIREQVPVAVRAASARALEHAGAPLEIVEFFAGDDADVAAPVVRGAALTSRQWLLVLPRLGPRLRAVLRHRRDLDAEVVRALEAFGATDFVLPVGAPEVASSGGESAPLAPEYGPSSFVSLGEAARGLPAVAAALRHGEHEQEAAAATSAGGSFEISELVARIAAYQRRRQTPPVETDATGSTPAGFRFETDSAGIVRWVEGVNRGPLIGLSLDLASLPGGAHVDGIASGAFRRRAGFNNARLVVEGASDAAGDWRITAIPVFDHASGRFRGYRGTARRPRVDEEAGPAVKPTLPPDSLRQLVHELRTPTTAIAGFAEMLEEQLLGPVADSYRARATVIRDQARELLAAIDDLDLAARIEGKALDLQAGEVALQPLFERIVHDLAPLAELRGTIVTLDPDLAGMTIAADDRAVERLIGRLMAVLVAAGGRDEAITVSASLGDGMAVMRFDRPAALTGHTNDTLLAIDIDDQADGDGAPLLGAGFALRLVKNLATELGGSFTLGAARLTLRLPAAVTSSDMGQVSTN